LRHVRSKKKDKEKIKKKREFKLNKKKKKKTPFNIQKKKKKKKKPEKKGKKYPALMVRLRGTHLPAMENKNRYIKKSVKSTTQNIQRQSPFYLI